MAECSAILWNVLFETALGTRSLYESLIRGLSECHEIAIRTRTKDRIWSFRGKLNIDIKYISHNAQIYQMKENHSTQNLKQLFKHLRV
jgi:hypothetical protein